MGWKMGLGFGKHNDATHVPRNRPFFESPFPVKETYNEVPKCTLLGTYLGVTESESEEQDLILFKEYIQWPIPSIKPD